MKATLVTVGSRGDAEPFCSLALALSKNNHQVDLFLQPEHNALLPSSTPNLQVHALPFNTTDFYKCMQTPPKHGRDHPNPRVRFIGMVTDMVAKLVLPCCKQVADTIPSAEKTDQNCALMVSSLARPLGQALALANPHCKLVIVHLQPLAPTADFPHYSNTEESVKAVQAMRNGSEAKSEAYLNGYWELEQCHHEFLLEDSRPMYESLGLSAEDIAIPREALLGNDDNTLIVNAFCDKVVPKGRDAGPNLVQVGGLADAPWQAAPDAAATEAIEQFLEACGETKPICVGYGSMPFQNVQVVLEAVKELNLKAVLVGSAFATIKTEASLLETFGKEWMDESVCQVSSIPYPWLLPRCRLMVCHGGAGVVNATLRAGIPIVISPLLGDQFFFAPLLEAQGLGAQAGDNLSSSYNRDDLIKAIPKALSCAEKSRQVGEAIRGEQPGVTKLVEILEAKWN